MHARSDARASVAPGGVAPHTLRHIPALDGIRGLAVVAVLLFHSGRLPGGYLGVDAFFVLSGFLITSLLLAEISRTGTIVLREFWLRRARRLLPALFAVLLAVALLAAVFASSQELGRIRADGFATIAYVANWHSIIADNSYGNLFGGLSPFEHTWSLAIEEQFYVIWPLMVLALAWLAGARRRTGEARSGPGMARLVFFISTALAAASAALMLVLYQPGGATTRVYYGTDTRAAGILFGAGLAAWIAWRGRRPGWGWPRITLETLALGAMVALGIAWATLDLQSPGLYQGGLLACGIAVTVVIAAAARPERGPVAWLLSLAPLRAIGLISYGLYLWHWPIYVYMTPDRIGLDGTALLASRLAITFAVAYVSYVLIEQPIRQRRFRMLRMRYAVPVAAVASTVALVFATSGATTPVAANPSRSLDGAARVITSPKTGSTAPPGQARLLIVGDSVASFIGEAAYELGPEYGLAVGTATVNGCVLTDEVDALRLATWLKNSPIELKPTCAPTWLDGAKSFSPTDVLVLYGNASGFEDFSLQGQWLTACEPAYDIWYRYALRSLISQIQALGATVHIANLAYPLAEWLPQDAQHRVACVNQVHQELARTVTGTPLVDLAGYVCPLGVCRESLNDRPLRPDGVHFLDDGARWIARWILGQFSPGNTSSAAADPLTAASP